LSRKASTWAEVSFLPAWRLIMTAKVRPLARRTESTMAAATSNWYDRRGRWRRWAEKRAIWVMSA